MRAVQNHRAGRFADAAILYSRALALTPEIPGGYSNLASALHSLGRYQDAEHALRQAIAQAPPDTELYLQLGFTLLHLHRKDDAIAAYRQALALNPDYEKAHFQLGAVLSENGDVAHGFAHYMRRAALVRGMGHNPNVGQAEPEHKIKHDREQQKFLGHNAPSGEINEIFVLADGSRIDGRAVNPLNMTDALLQTWKDRDPQFVVIENFLTSEALEKLRYYCAGSTIWRRVYRAGYLGAPPEEGLACPLMAQVIEELQEIYAAILKQHQFRYLGAFKYDSTLSTGTNTHADNSAVNINIYITPDDANEDPQSGGMDIWNVRMPPDVDMRIYNGNEVAATNFLKRSKARKYVVPHRANRAVIFQSDLFHKTGDCHFKEGYLNRRINISMLFGDRGAPTR
jgi:hypothetical protein